jgi:GTP-dependent phosphoenolpyruvate carboxykinase
MDGALTGWANEIANYTKPDAIQWCDGSALEARILEDRMLADGTLIALAAPRRSFLHRSDPTDVARTEHLTFICSKDESEARPTNNWMSPDSAAEKVWPLFEGAMRGRRMYVVPYLMGPVESPYSRVGVQITDSAYVVANLRIMTRIGESALRFDRAELDVSDERFEELLSVDPQAWSMEAHRNETFLSKFAQRLPDQLWREPHGLVLRLRQTLS